ncbi:hypothetical protein [Leeuwenhoekiella sp.]|jgi:hypothetical protein|uniref:hypothetical protein n=1 Tax=Leeuwenhoekiella sp. TaxID=1977054 RepID=UPI000C596CEE|nr:hypothetical protein [Leeuwenhoekiella sp.]MAO42145.1 hypothetical protein [Leeuwenhoekiella sp.]|tara:strand:- start:1188 stop:1418 length:231 start_codon:yes stop_codon:yes gene_type:complete
MASDPNIHCVNFELEYIDVTDRGFINNKIVQFLYDTPKFIIKSVSVTLTKENKYLVVAVVEYFKEAGYSTDEPNNF